MRGLLRRRLVFGFSIVVLLGVVVFVPAPAAAVTVTVPYSAIPVAAGDLDGNPATGAWSDVTPITLPLENAQPAPYGTVSFYAKHDGTNVYFRVDGKIDVLWVSKTGNHFWFAMQVSPTNTAHHSGGTWDGVFFGEDYYTAAAPLVAVDTSGFSKNPPPAKDTAQDDLGRMQASGAASPYSFTAEWMRHRRFKRHHLRRRRHELIQLLRHVGLRRRRQRRRWNRPQQDDELELVALRHGPERRHDAAHGVHHCTREQCARRGHRFLYGQCLRQRRRHQGRILRRQCPEKYRNEQPVLLLMGHDGRDGRDSLARGEGLRCRGQRGDERGRHG